ncbi:MAG: phospholipase D-like domain-containing protein [Chloroflexi bacterium]|nr:phospholipase D-like domain-containing protein [Chloroflexota bacterium]
MYIHSKVGVIDDQFTVGSSNLNTQSFVHDSEANLAVRDRDEAWRLAVRLWTSLLPPGMAPAAGAPPGDAQAVAAWFAALEQTAQANLARDPAHPQPTGLLIEYPYRLG